MFDAHSGRCSHRILYFKSVCQFASLLVLFVLLMSILDLMYYYGNAATKIKQQQKSRRNNPNVQFVLKNSANGSTGNSERPFETMNLNMS